MDIHLIRHPRTVAPLGMCYGAMDLEPDPAHLAADAARLAPALPPNARFVASSQQRARKLAEALAGGQSVATDDRLVEIDFGEWEGKMWQDLPHNHVSAWTANADGTQPPGGESVARAAQRVREWWDSVEIEDTPLVVVSHGGPLRLIAAHITGASPARSIAFEIKWGHRALVWHNPEHTALAGWNLR